MARNGKQELSCGRPWRMSDYRLSATMPASSAQNRRSPANALPNRPQSLRREFTQQWQLGVLEGLELNLRVPGGNGPQ